MELFRVAKIRTKKGLQVRLIQRLYPLENHSSIPQTRMPSTVDLSRTPESPTEDEAGSAVAD